MMLHEKRRVLVVEDDAVIRAWLEAGLDEQGWTVHCAVDGSEALHLLCEEDGACFDLILLDVWLPEMNGLEVLRTLRGLGVPCPVIVMTAYEDSFDPEHALELGAADVVMKPFDVRDLAERVRVLVN